MMILLLTEAIKRSGGDELMFFQTAYYAIFNKHHDCVNDVVQWRLHAIVPPYIKNYLRKKYDV